MSTSHRMNQGDTVLRVQDLGIRLRPGRSAPEGRMLLQGCSFELRAGERLTLVGESGAGKSLLAQAIMGTLPDVMQASGQVQIAGRETNGQRTLTQPLWGQQIVMLPQEPWTALNPVMRLRTQVAEAGRYAAGRRWPDALAQADRHLAALGLAHAGRQWLHQVSGGMAQRVGMACASQSDARVLVADEPTKGLDAGACEQVAQLLADAQRQGQALLTITHDLDLALRLGGRVAVMRQGRIVEAGDVAAVLHAPQHGYTRELIAAQPRHWPSLAPVREAAKGEVVVSAEQVSVSFGERAVLQGASLPIAEGESVAVVGPSGCGKTTLGNVMVGALTPRQGTVRRRAGVPAWRFQKLYQDPVASFAPGQTLRRGIHDLLQLHRLDANPTAHWLQRLRLSDELLDRLPGEVSGGELQRLAILRAMLLQPVFVFADEPTSRLDALTQRETMAALCEAMAEGGCAMLLVSHDPDLARNATHRQTRFVAGRLSPS
ncbi:ABC transporter ATP-binding protein [Hydrogenophaga flava]|uniref:ABC transporter ATP-binding protein n=1 Tax=Hydrogenophaga flava TaxID=65657 RepID=UPI000826C5D3|nr:ATP-binding cassette domain-containing protein [Hydrogenophaga flava]